jgi:hypothetical protein
MARNHARRRRGIAILLALFAVPLAHHGCASPVESPPPPGGGVELVLDYDRFVAEVEPVLERHGCDAGGDCHGGGIRGSLALSPAGAKDPAFDFAQVSLQVSPTAIPASPILTEPLALGAGGTPHGVKPFATTDDDDYRAVRAWIEAGVTP